MSGKRLNWSVDIDTEAHERFRWQPFCFDDDGTVVTSLDIWFATEQDAKDWVLANLVNVTHVWEETP